MLILKEVKVLCFDTLLQVFILKGLRRGLCWRLSYQTHLLRILILRLPMLGDRSGVAAKRRFGDGSKESVR